MTKPKNSNVPSEKKPTGRPPGSPNVRETAVAVPSRCNACGSTERGPYLDKTELEFGGVDSQGKPFTHIVRRRVRCAGCGQMRIDVARENRLFDRSPTELSQICSPHPSSNTGGGAGRTERR